MRLQGFSFAVAAAAILLPASHAGAQPATYYGCLTPGGTLTHVSTTSAPACPDGSNLVSWNQTGPEGAAGPQGPQGPQGPPGPAGSTVSAFTSRLDPCLDASGAGNCPAVDPLNTFPLTPVLSVNVPAGDYVLLQTVQLVNLARFPDEENGRRVQCFLMNKQGAAGVLAHGDVYVDGTDAGRTPAGQITLHASRTFTEATTVFVACRAALAEADRIQVFVGSATLTALRLDALFQQ